MVDPLSDLRGYVDALMTEFDIGAITLQVCDRSDDEHRVVQLLDLRVPSEASWTYQARRVFAQDPFTDVDLNDAPDLIYSDVPIAVADPRIEQQRAHSPAYWAFLDRYGMTVEGVSTRRLRRGVFTVAGYLRDAKQSYAQPLPTAALTQASTMLHNMMGAEVLRGTLRSNAGLIGLQRMLAAPAAADDLPAPPLSPREREVATMVARGRQTKEVAYQLRLSEHTVENHLRRIYAKLGIHSRTQLAHLLG